MVSSKLGPSKNSNDIGHGIKLTPHALEMLGVMHHIGYVYIYMYIYMHINLYIYTYIYIHQRLPHFNLPKVSNRSSMYLLHTYYTYVYIYIVCSFSFCPAFRFDPLGTSAPATSAPGSPWLPSSPAKRSPPLRQPSDFSAKLHHGVASGADAWKNRRGPAIWGAKRLGRLFEMLVG